MEKRLDRRFPSLVLKRGILGGLKQPERVRSKEGVLDKEHYNILIFGPKTSRTHHLKIRKKTLKITLYLFAFALLSAMFLFCDYIQVKKKAFEIARLRQKTEVQRSQIHFFSAKILLMTFYNQGISLVIPLCLLYLVLQNPVLFLLYDPSELL